MLDAEVTDYPDSNVLDDQSLDIQSDGFHAPTKIAVWGDWIVREFAHQIPHRILWYPVALAVGIGTYFSLPVDPPIWSGALVLFLSIAVYACASRNRVSATSISAFGFMLFALGFCAAQIRTERVTAPILPEEIGPTVVLGTVVQTEPVDSASRVLLDRLEIAGVTSQDTPERVRIRLPGSHGQPNVGERISVRAILRPPGRPVAPGAFDFQRYSFFKKMGGVGFSVGRWSSQGFSEDSEPSFADQIMTMRAHVGTRLAEALPNESGAVARALVTGERNAVPEALQEAYRRAGLAHMLAISGLHMSLIAGLAFVALRFTLALFRPIAERYDTKKIAAVAALLSALFYLVLSGANVPAQRAFIMIGVIFTAVLFDRSALSLRTLACAALFVLLLQPESLVGASFQLSFAAVVALITVYERVQIRSRLRDRYGNFQPFRAVMLYCGAILVTDLIATGATAPFTGFHFHQVPSYSLLANLLAGPVMGLWVMPCALAALVLMPLGLEQFALIPMGAGIEIVDGVARYVAALPGATLYIPPTNVGALACVGAGGLLLCLWRGSLRWAGIPVMLIGLLQPWLSDVPSILINENAEVMAVRGPDQHLILSPGRREGFTRGVWTELWQRSSTEWEDTDALSCDLEGCIYQSESGNAALSYTEAAVQEDCGKKDLLIARVPTVRLCNQRPQIDRFDVWRHGAHAVWLESDQVRITRVSDYTGKRIWNQPTWR